MKNTDDLISKILNYKHATRQSQPSERSPESGGPSKPSPKLIEAYLNELLAASRGWQIIEGGQSRSQSRKEPK